MYYWNAASLSATECTTEMLSTERYIKTVRILGAWPVILATRDIVPVSFGFG